MQYSTDESTWTDANHSGTTRSKTISGLTNGTLYYVQVRATNSSGSSSWSSSSSATPDVAPGKPNAPTVTIGDQSLSVSWTQPSNSGSAITGYDVQYKKTSESTWTAHSHGDTTTSTTISGLDNGTSYHVQVRAYNANVKGSWSNSTTGTPNILPGTPDAPTVTRGNGSLSVSWTKPSNSGSAITGYVVRRCSGSNCDSETNPTWTNKNVSGGSTTSTTLSSLTNGTEYSVQVAAKNTAGTGSFSSSSTGTPATTPATPSAPTVTRGATGQLKVSWSAPSSNGGSAISSYDVGYCSTNCNTASSWTLIEDESGTNTTIGGLTNGTAYKVRVRATNDVGDSSWSSQTTGTPDTTPGAPGTPTLTIKVRSLGLSWSAASNNGSAITDYDVQYCEHKPNASTNPNDCTKSTATWTEWNASNTSTTRSATITGLTNGSEYYVQVRAQNAAGNGSWSSSSKATPDVAPSTPTGLTVTRGHSELLVSWTASVNNGTEITGYDVSHCDKSKDCTKDTNWTEKSVSTLSMYITGLTNGTTYKVRLRAGNAAGYSSWTSSVEGTPATTPGQPSMSVVTNSDEQVTVTWTAPTDNGGSTITDYDVQYCVSDEKFPAACVGDWTIWKPNQTSTALSATITGLTNGTEYLLAARAANVAGEGSWSSHTWGDPDVVPGKPKSVAVASGDKQITVTWSAADTDGSAITGYDLGTCTGTCSNDSDWSVNFLSVVYTRTVTKHPKNGSPLVNGTTYKVRVAAVNDHGTGPWSATVSGKAGKLPGVPTSVSVTAGNTQLSVSWSAPSDSGTGAISDYDVQYKESSGSTWTEWNASNTSTTTSATITGLTNDTQYDVQVRAQTEYGHSAWSSTTAGTPDVVPGTPGAPTLTRGNTQLSVSWSAPSNSGSAISDYDVQYCEHKPNASQNANDCTKSSGTWTEWNSSNTSTTRSATITGLTNGTEYYVQVRAQNAAGNGSWSSSRKATPATKPSTPSPTVSAGHRQLVVSWDAPSDGGDDISDYDVQYKKSSVSTWTNANHSGTGTTKTISSLTNGTEYDVQVRATNSVGDSAWSSSVSGTPDQAPRKPSKPTVTRGDQQLSVSWSAPTNNGTDITDYDVQYKKSSDSDWTSHSFTGTGTSTTITGLDNGTQYDVQVRAENDAGEGAWSDSRKATPATTPSAPSPTVSEGHRQLVVSWSEPSDGGDDITDYDVQYCEHKPNAPQNANDCTESTATWTDANHSGTATTKTISSLTNGTTYHVQVRAENGVGNGSWSSSVSGMPDQTPRKPSKPTVTRGNAQLSVSWSAPTNNGTAISDYDVQYKKSSDDDWTSHSFTGTGTSTTISSLDNGTQYDVQVRAENDEGDGAWSDSGTGTPSTTPGKPAKPTLTAGNKQIAASWSAPSSDGGAAITDYDVRYCDHSDDCTDDDNWTEWDSGTTSTTTSATVTGLTNGTTYQVQVRAGNVAGDGAWSDSSNAKPDTTPDKPDKPEVTRGDTELSVSWDAPDNDGTAITDYDVRYCSSNCTNSNAVWTEWQSSNTSTTRSATITGLTNGTKYYVQVRAQNAAGNGPWSDSTSATPNVKPQKPSAPTLARGNASLAVSWSAPTNEGTAITDYDVQYKKSSDSTWTEWRASNTSTSLTATITGLTNGTEYDVQVRAQNDADNGDWSDSSSATPSTVPSKPGAPTLTAGDEQIAVSWDAPSSDGGATVTDYDVRYRKSTVSDWTEWNASDTSTTRTATITGLTNGTYYHVSVRATNIAGDSSWSSYTQARPNVVPEAPDAPTVTRGNKSLSVSWDEPDNDGSAITDYDVRYCSTTCSSESNWTEWNSGNTSTSTSATITGLDNGTEYEVQVSAQNAKGNGDWSESGTGTPATKPATPAKPTLTMGDKQLAVTWDAPDDNGTAITDYDVQYKKTSVSNYTEWNASDTSTTRSATITGLTNGLDYHVRVRATNDVGDSSWSSPKTGSPNVLPGKPAAPTLTRKDRSLGVSWTPPTNTGSALTGFTVRHCSSDCTENTAVWTEKSISSGTTINTTIGSLTNGTEYHVQVRARNKGGNGPWSDSAKETANAVPGTASTPTVSRGNTQLSVSWNEPSNNGTAITDYDVQYCSASCSNESSWTEWNADNTSTTRSATITGLTNGTEYEVQVSAQNAAGNGAWSSSRKATPATTPSAPSPTVGAGSRQLVVTWLEPNDGGDDINDYDVRYKESSKSNWTNANHSGTGRSRTITGLTNGKTYHVQVRARNSVGHSAWSASGSGKPDIVPGRPGAPTVSRGVEQLSVSWSPPSNSGSAISDYDVQYKKESDNDWTSHSFTGTDTSTTISSLDNGAEYEVQVRAENDKGEGAWSPSGSGTPSTTPDAPAAPTLTAGHRKLTVNWSAPTENGGAAITDYDVQYKKTSDNTWTDANHSGASTSRTISSLDNGVEYQVQVRAGNVAGNGDWSDRATATPDTLPGKSNAPTVARANEALDVSWTAPSNSGSALTGFKVGHCSASCNNDGSWTSKTVSGGSTTSTTITGLTNGTSYQVKVRATNDLGDGPWSNATSRTPSTAPSQPSKPTLSASDRRIAVSWDAPANGGATISDYDVQYKKTSDNTWTDANHSGASRSRAISGLTNGAEYEVQVRAENVAGDGAWSDSETATPDVLPSTPGAPTVARADQSLVVTWNAPSNNGSAITDYDVQYKKSSENTWVEWNADDTGTTRSATITGLTNGTKYDVRVRATNGAGDTAWSSKRSATPSTTPSKPYAPTLTMSSRTINVSWSAPVDGGADITDYDVQYKASADSTWIDTKHSGTSTSRKITGLTNGTEYEVQVRAKNIAGNSDWSDSATETPDVLPNRPSKPDLLVGETSLMVTWSPPINSGSAITSYDVQYKKTADSTWTQWNATDKCNPADTSTEPCAMLNGLTTDSEYEVQVRATNDLGDTPWSSSASATPVAALPAPTNVTSTPYNGAIAVQWTAVDDATGYEVQYREQSGQGGSQGAAQGATATAQTTQDWNAILVSGGSTTSMTIRNLTNDTTYDIRVRATNENTLEPEWKEPTQNETRRKPLETLPDPDDPPVVVVDTGPRVYRGNLTELPDREDWAAFWFPVFADSCPRDEPSWIQPAWVTEPDPNVCGVLYLSGRAREGLREPAGDLAFAAFAAVIKDDLDDRLFDAPAPQGYARKGQTLDLDLWALYPHPQRDANAPTLLAGEISPFALLCLPQRGEGELAIGQWLREDSPSGAGAHGWRIHLPLLLVHDEHVCAMVDRLTYFAVFRQR